MFARHRIAAEARGKAAGDARIEALEAKVLALTNEIEEGDEWTQLVDTFPLDHFDCLGEVWISRQPIIRMTNAIASVFVKYANENIMSRFREQLRTMMHQAFVEGCVVGVRHSRAKSTKGPNNAS
jgi:hypothetical protein